MICTQQDVIREALVMEPQLQPVPALVEKLSHKYHLSHREASNLVKEAIQDRVIVIQFSTRPHIKGWWIAGRSERRDPK